MKTAKTVVWKFEINSKARVERSVGPNGLKGSINLYLSNCFLTEQETKEIIEGLQAAMAIKDEESNGN